MEKPTLLVLRTPDSEDDKQRFAEGLALLEPYRTSISQQAERSVLEFMSDRRYVVLPNAAQHPVHEIAEVPRSSEPADTIENRGIVSGLVAVGGIGLLMLLSYKVKLTQEIVAASLVLIASVSFAIVLPLLRRRKKLKE